MNLDGLCRAASQPILAARGGGRWRRSRHLLRCEQGVSAIEFGLIAPLLFFSLLAMTDVGFALHDRIRVDHVLRAGAQPAMRDAGETYVLATLAATAQESYTVADVGGPDAIAVGVDRFCICPSTGVTDTTCTSTCTVEPTRFYTLSASKSYQGIFLPEIAFAPSILVQVR